MSEFWDDELEPVPSKAYSAREAISNKQDRKLRNSTVHGGNATWDASNDIWDDETESLQTQTYYKQEGRNFEYKQGYKEPMNKMPATRTQEKSGYWDDRRMNSSERYADRDRKSAQDGFWGNRSRQSKEDSLEIQIDSNCVGKVIGRGGTKIRELESESGARIKVFGNNGDNLTTIRLIGSSSAQDKAKELIEELTSDFKKLSYNDGRPENHSNNRNSKNWDERTFNRSNDVKNTSDASSTTELIDWDSLLKQSEEAKQRKLAALPKIVKDFYHEDPVAASMTSNEAERFRAANNDITIKKTSDGDSRPIPNPVTSFAQAFQHYPELLSELKKQGFTTPSPIQCQAWPIIMKGYDMIGIAQTGTGKTIAFLFPALIHIIGQPIPREERVGPSCLILAPTRELAQQIEVEAKKYCYHNIKSVCVYGGGSRKNQINVVTKGVDIIIATPGRLYDLVLNKIVDVSGVTYLVLDEADRMLDLGFEPQIRKLLLDVRPDRQTIMTSATWTSEVQLMAKRYMTDPFKVNVGALSLAAVHTVTQHIIFANDEDRRPLLEEFFTTMEPDDKVIVFVERKSVADDLSSDLLLNGMEVQSIHGDREQYDREQALQDLKNGDVHILIATDVASRGLDIKDITHIFNMYFPRNIEEYVHRVGRTGRAGRSGQAITIVTPKDWMHAEELLKILEEANQFVPQELCDMARRYRAWRQKKDAEDAAAGGRRFRRGGPRRF